MLVSRTFAPRLRSTMVAGLLSLAVIARIDAQTQSSQTAAPQAIPTKLSDSAFWKLVTDYWILVSKPVTTTSDFIEFAM